MPAKRNAAKDAAPDTSTQIADADLTPEQEGFLQTLAAELEGKSLWAKIMWVQHHVGQVAKTGQMSHGNIRYAFMQEHGLINVIRPLCRVAGLGYVPGMVNPGDHSSDGNTYTVVYGLTVFDAEGDSITRYYPGMGIDSQDKGYGKAQTGATKYALQKFFLVPTDQIDDNDVLSAEKLGGTPVAAQVADANSDHAPASEVAELRALLIEQGKKIPALDRQKVKTKLTADYAVSNLQELTKPQFSEFSAWVVAAIAAPPE